MASHVSRLSVVEQLGQPTGRSKSAASRPRATASELRAAALERTNSSEWMMIISKSPVKQGVRKSGRIGGTAMRAGEQIRSARQVCAPKRIASSLSTPAGDGPG